MTTKEKLIKKLKDCAVIRITCLPEYVRIEGNASAIDPETDKKICDQIHAELKNGNYWAWCCIKVSALFEEFEGAEYLGCCSYDSEESFKKGGYYEDMLDAAFNDLADQILNAQTAINNLME